MLAAVVGLVAGLVSLARILVVNSNALSDLVWAEDGLFAQCVKMNDPLSCTVEPYAGYLLVLPRLVAIPVSLVPVDSWPLATNLAAAVLAGALAALIVVILRAAGRGIALSVLVALLPVILPLIGVEAINSTASSYMLVPFVAALAVCFPPRGRFQAVPVAALLLLAELSNPLTVVLVVIVAVHGLRGRIPRQAALLCAGALGLGLVAQAVAALTAQNPRRIVWSVDSVVTWAERAPSAVVELWRSAADAATSGSTVGAVVTVALLIGAIVLLLPRYSATANGIGMLLLLGIAMGVLPALAGEPNNRYFIPAALAWTTAALVALDERLSARRELVMGVVAAGIVLLCVPGFGASTFRTYAAPPWPEMIELSRQACAASPDGGVRVMFTPSWPYEDAALTATTTNGVYCSQFVRW